MVIMGNIITIIIHGAIIIQCPFIQAMNMDDIILGFTADMAGTLRTIHG